MSKWLVPPQDLASKVTKQPLVTRVYGVHGDEDAKRVVQHFQASVSQFLRAQTQQRANSGLDVYKVREQHPDLRMSYSYIHGQEYLDIYVAEPVVKQVLNPEDWWDWALIEIIIPHTNMVQPGVFGAIFKAHRTVPGPESAMLFDGFAYDRGKDRGDSVLLWSDGKDPFSISWAPQTEPFRTLTRGNDINQRSAVLVDLRTFPKSQCVLDIYGYLDIGGGGHPGIVGWQRNATPDTTSHTYTNLGAVTYPSGWPFDVLTGQVLLYDNLGFRVNYNDTSFAPLKALLYGPLDPAQRYEVMVPAPNAILSSTTAAGGSTQTFWADSQTFDAASNLLTGLTQYGYFEHFDPSTSTTSTNSFIDTAVFTWNISPIIGTIPDPPTPETRTGPISGVGGKGWPDWVVTKFDAPYFDFAQWDVRPMLPDHIGTGGLGNVIVDYGNNADANPYKHLGTVIIDPIRKSISFKAA